MVRKFIYSIVFFLLFQLTGNLQENKISEKQKELNNLKAEITSLQKELNLKSKKEKASFSAIENYNRQGHLLNKMISKLKEEEALKEHQIRNNEQEINRLRQDIKMLQDNYAKYVRAVYKYGKIPQWAAFIDAGSLNRALVRVEYLQRFAEYREKDLIKLKQNKNKLAGAVNILESEKKEKSILVSQKRAEENELNQKLDERKKILNAIKNDKAELKKELNAKRDAESAIKNMIARLVEEAERKRREETERIARLQKEKLLLADNKTKESPKNISSESALTYDVDLSTSSFSSFAEAKGKLVWPVSGGTIIRRYGESKNKKLNTVTMNNGIDIKAGKDLNVKSVSDGVISAVEWVPGFGSVIIITHKGDYRTVYSHLSGIFIKEGDKVKRGTLIAKTAESTDGNILHFEIWNSRTNLNPEQWLAKK